MKHYGLIGKPVAHSRSKAYFTEKFEREHIDAEFGLYELDRIEDFTNLCKQIPFTGLNVTAPYKQAIIPYLDRLDESAASIQAVNVIKFCKDGSLVGYNTDLIGFRESIRPHIGGRWKALVLGTGGASRAIEGGLKQLGVEVILVSRTPHKDASRSPIYGYESITKNVMARNPIIVNATPLGMEPLEDQMPPIPYEFITDRHLLFDAIYNPAKTRFLLRGEEHFAEIMNGKEMHSLQAVAAWDIWNQ